MLAFENRCRISRNPHWNAYPFKVLILLLAMVLAGVASVASAQDQDPPAFTREQLEQLVAPIALYPDSLLSQVLMASTYPLEIVEAYRWTKDNPDVTGDALETAMQEQPWDPSVKSLTAFPDVLQMMNEELSWTQQLGDAFLAQQEQVLAAVQDLRARADAEGNLETTKEQKVEKETVTADSGSKETVYVIQPANPEVVYVPAYNPMVVYGTWPYPAYQPYYWYPPGYVASRALWFGAGIAVGAALWGNCDWRRGSVNINVNRYNSFNRTNITSNSWTHNATHRRGVAYRDTKVASQYRGATRDVRSREQFRGRAEAGRRDLPNVKPPAAGQRPSAVPRPSQRPEGGQRPSAGQRPGGGQRPDIASRPSTPQRPEARPSRPTAKPAAKPAARPATRPAAKPAARPAQQRRPSAVQGVGQGRQVRSHSARGQHSRQAARPSAPRGGGGRGGGGRRR